MKILHIGCCAVGAPYEGLSLALSKLGEYREINSGHHNLEDEIIHQTYDFKPDIVFCQIQRDGVLSPYSVKYLRSIGAWVCNWTGDVRVPVPEWYFKTGVDCTLFSNMHDVRVFRQSGLPSEYLQIGFDPTIFCPGEEKNPCEEIIFFGTNYGNMFPLSEPRRKMVYALREEFGDRFGVYGGGWENANGNLTGGTNDHQREECKHLRSAKIGINFSHFAYERYSSDRIHRIMGSGLFCLSHWYPYVEQDYAIGKHLDIFHSLNECIDRCKFYLDMDEQREYIAEQGMKWVHNRHTYDRMIKNLIEIYNNSKA